MPIVPDYELYLPYYMSILIHGGSDAGKTTLASFSPDLDPKEPLFIEDTLFLDVEGGTVAHLTRGAGIVVERYPKEGTSVITDKETLSKGIEYLKANKARFNNVALDTLDRYQEYAMESIMRERGHKRPEMQDWGDLLISLQRLGRQVPTWGVNVAFTCHTGQALDDADRLTKMMPLIQGSFQGRLASYFDVVAYYEQVEDASGNVVRRLHTRGTKKFHARSRLGGCLPETIDNPTLPSLIDNYRTRRSEVITALKKKFPSIKILGAGGDKE